MTTLNQKVLLQAKLHKALHRNVYLLGLYYPMSNELSSYFKESMFEKPNAAAFHHLSYYLMSIIDPKYTASSSCWAMFEVKIEAKYRVVFLNLVGKISKEHPGHVSHIMASWIVNAGGVRVAKLMFELSQVALKLHLQRRSEKPVNLNINELKMEEINPLSVEIRDSLLKKVTWWHTTSIHMKNISNIYQKWLPIIEKERLDKQMLLETVGSLVNCQNPLFAEQLNSIFTKNTFLENWSKLIDDKILNVEINWNNTSSSILDVARKCKSRSEQLVRMQSKQCKDSILQYDEANDIFQVPPAFEAGLSVSQSAILKSNVQNGILNFPNLLKSYSVVITHSFQFYTPSPSTATFQNALEEKKSLVMFIKEQSKDLIIETCKFHDQLKEAVAPEEYSCTSLQSPIAFYEIPSFPSVNMQFKFGEDHSDYWCNCLEKFKFTEFKHPFQNHKAAYLPEQEDNKIIKPNSSIIKKTLEFNSETTLNKKVITKPDYMKNIEELKRNMEIISDISNKSCLTQRNMTTIGNFGTERKQLLFSSNHIRNLLTSVKKGPTSTGMNKKQKLNDRSFCKMRGNLFDQSSEDLPTSVLQKTVSSPNLLCDLASESKRPSRINRPVSVNERISGIMEIDYSSFLSELRSTPKISPKNDNQSNNNISGGSSQKDYQQQSTFSSSRKDNSSLLKDLNISSACKKENIPRNNQHNIIPETVSVSNIQTFSDDDFKKPESTPPFFKKATPPRRKSVESLIDLYKQFKLKRGIGATAQKKSDASTLVLGDSFLERLDLGDNKEIDKKLPSKEDSLFLSSVPDLLSPSLDYQNRSNMNHK